MREIRVRFAPSPTGHLHIGGARTALFNYLFAKRYGGKFILRIEDTDLNRSSYESEQVIVEDLKWLGITWDEGVEAEGNRGPYRSTERIHIYKEYVDRLISEKKGYKCFCSAEELEEERKTQEEKGETPKYNGKCRNLTYEQINSFEQEGKKYTVRIRVPENEIIKVDDKVRGIVEFESNGVGDFIVVKSDGIPVYNFAVVIDDYLMEITHVIRAEEHLSNTPRQIVIYDAFGFEKPSFAHVSLILGHDRTKMSKRHGSTWVEQYRESGYLPEALVNFLVLLGWSPEGEQEIMTMDEMVAQFSLDRVSKNPAVFDDEKLNWMNSQYIKMQPIEKITDMAISHLKEAGMIEQKVSEERYEWLKGAISSIRSGLVCIKEVPEKLRLFFDENIEPENEEAAEMLKLEHVPSLLGVLLEKVNSAQKIDTEFTSTIFKVLQQETGIKGKNLFMPIRVALSGQTHGPDINEMIIVLGKENIIKRINRVLNK